MATTGRFVWHELMTTDVEAAIAFYTEVIGWKTQQWKGANADMEYTMFCVDERPIGGVLTLPEEAAKMGVPPHWLGHCAVPDVAQAAAKARDRGATVHKEIDIPEVGKFAIVADPQGAVMSYFRPKDKMPSASPQVGDISWNELNTTDYEAAFAYYRDIFGWQETDAVDMGPEAGTYFMFKYEGAVESIGGMSNAAKAFNMPPHWLYYIKVDDIDAAIGRVTSHGGKVMNGPMDVPGGKIAQCTDPQGVAFAIHAVVEGVEGDEG